MHIAGYIAVAWFFFLVLVVLAGIRVRALRDKRDAIERRLRRNNRG